ncbi:MAG: hypothetical protein WC755_05115 [Candidatus Woesearchaeota archaeon]|jgi:uncharacterized protein YlxW (UPF0749 family)
MLYTPAETWVLNHSDLISNTILVLFFLFISFIFYIKINYHIYMFFEKRREKKNQKEEERKRIAKERKLKLEEKRKQDVEIARQSKSKVKENKIEQTVKNIEQCKSTKRVNMQIIAKPTITDIKTEMPTVEAKPTKGIYVIVDDCFYRESEITLNDVHYLISKNCVKEKFYSINTKKTESFLLKPRHNESVSHFFVIRDIVDYLKKSKAEHIVINATQNPDIAFTRFGKKYGIEVETGKMLKSGKMRIIEKVKDMNKKFDDWFFVVTDKNLKKKYIQFADTVDKRGIAKRLTKMRVFVR